MGLFFVNVSSMVRYIFRTLTLVERMDLEGSRARGERNSQEAMSINQEKRLLLMLTVCDVAAAGSGPSSLLPSTTLTSQLQSDAGRVFQHLLLIGKAFYQMTSP